MELPLTTIVPMANFSPEGSCSKASAMVMFMKTSYPRSVPVTLRDPLSWTDTFLSKYWRLVCEDAVDRK